MCLSLLLDLIALTVHQAAPMALAGPVGFGVYIHRFQIRPEERALEAKFGGAYADYRLRRWP